jgi:hypothetical protein
MEEVLLPLDYQLVIGTLVEVAMPWWHSEMILLWVSPIPLIGLVCTEHDRPLYHWT